MAKVKERKPEYIDNGVFDSQEPVEGIDKITFDTKNSARPVRYLGFVTSTSGINASV